ncbi:MAG: glycosyltransferase [Candidatus Omnitrophota bacterium]|nr:glycosyltransferase [Candidatus Omnitrophota bacterium]
MNPKVNVLMITYNQEQYIGQAIESVLAQRVNFTYELVIGEDCSTDGTREICRTYHERYPEKIRLLRRGKNLGMMPNFFQTLAECKGEYIAILEGDDYWTDPYKLQKQIDFMVSDTDCTLVFHSVEVLSGVDSQLMSAHNYDSSGLYIKKNTPDQYIKKEDIIMHSGSFISTPSIMFRADILSELPHWLLNALIGDYPLTLLAVAKGNAYFINEVMAAYRLGVPGSAVSRNKDLAFEDKFKIYKNVVSTLNGFNEYTNRRFENAVKERISDTLYYFLVSYSYVDRRRRLNAYNLFKKNLKYAHRKEIWLGLFPCFKPIFALFSLLKKNAWRLLGYLKSSNGIL